MEIEWDLKEKLFLHEMLYCNSNNKVVRGHLSTNSELSVNLAPLLAHCEQLCHNNWKSNQFFSKALFIKSVCVFRDGRDSVFAEPVWVKI